MYTVQYQFLTLYTYPIQFNLHTVLDRFVYFCYNRTPPLSTFDDMRLKKIVFRKWCTCIYSVRTVYIVQAKISLKLVKLIFNETF